MRGLRVLVVESDPVVSSGLLSLLEALDCQAEVVSDAPTAWDRVRWGAPLDLILIDVSVSQVGGMALLVGLHGELPDLTLVAMSRDYHHREPALWGGAREFLLRPFGWTELRTTLERVAVLSRHRAAAPAGRAASKDPCLGGRAWTQRSAS